MEEMGVNTIHMARTHSHYLRCAGGTVSILREPCCNCDQQALSLTLLGCQGSSDLVDRWCLQECDLSALVLVLWLEEEETIVSGIAFLNTWPVTARPSAANMIAQEINWCLSHWRGQHCISPWNGPLKHCCVQKLMRTGSSFMHLPLKTPHCPPRKRKQGQLVVLNYHVRFIKRDDIF